MPDWTPRQPRLDYGAAEAMRELSILILGLAKESVKEKRLDRIEEVRNQRQDKKDNITRLSTELSKKEEERNFFVGETIRTQNAINAITEETTSLKDIYATGKVPGITADVTDQPIKYYNQKIKQTTAQMDILKPFYGKAVAELGDINRLLEFLQKGVGVSPGEDEIYGPEDFLPEVYAPDRPLTKSEQAVFERYPVSQSLLDQLSASQVIAQKGRLDIAGGYARKKELELIELEEKYKDIKGYKASVGRYNEYASEIRNSNMYFFDINNQQVTYDTELDPDDKEILGEELDIMYLREGAGFFPEVAGGILGFSYNSPKEKLEEISEEVDVLVSSGRQLSPEEFQKVEAWKSLRARGVKLRNENLQKYDTVNVKRGVVTVQPYLERDRMLAEAYYRYKKMSDEDKKSYRVYIKNALGIDFHNRATVRNRLKRYFMEDLPQQYTGGVPYKDLDKSDKEFFMERALEIKETLGFDISTGEFIDE